MAIQWLTRKILRARPGEEKAVGLAFLYFFMLLCAYYLLRPVRDAMGSGAGVDNLRWFYTGTFVSMLVLTPFYGALVSRVRKQLLVPIAYGFFASNLLVFYFLFKLMADSFWVAASFFVWLSVFNYFVVSLFWSFMVDVFRDEEGKRLFGPIAAGGGTGAIVGSFITQDIVPTLGVDAVVGLAMLLLLGTLPCIRGLAHWAEVRHGHFVLPKEAPDSRIGGRMLAGLLLVARSPYLIGIFTVLAIGSIAGAWMYIELLRFAGEAYVDDASRTQFFARLDLAINILSWIFQGLVVAWLIRVISLPGALVAVPIAALLTFVALCFALVAGMPILAVLAGGQIIRRAGEFGIAKPSREVLFTIVDTETKYKAKNFIETVMQRGSDLVGIWLHVSFQALGLGLFGLSVLCGAGMVAAGMISFGLGRSFERLRAGTS